MFQKLKYFMEKETLIKLIKEKSADRKRSLFQMYGDLINSTSTVKNIINSIHLDLGEDNLVKVTDIEYCRRRFLKGKRLRLPKSIHKIESDKVVNQVALDDLKWTNPDEIVRETVRSKFAK